VKGLQVETPEEDKSIRAIWKAAGYSPESLAEEVRKYGAKCRVPTLYKLAHRTDKNVEFGTIKAVCQIFGLTLDQYDRLPPCPHSREYTVAGEPKKKGKRHENL
jgi:hypothetical protein